MTEKQIQQIKDQLPAGEYLDRIRIAPLVVLVLVSAKRRICAGTKLPVMEIVLELEERVISPVST